MSQGRQRRRPPCPPAYPPLSPGGCLYSGRRLQDIWTYKIQSSGFPPRAVSPSSRRVGLCLFRVGGSILQQKQEEGTALRNGLFRPPECGPRWRKKPGLWRMGEEEGPCLLAVYRRGVLEKGEEISFAAWVQGPAPRNQAKNGFISLPYTLASVIAAAVLFLLHLFGVYLYGCKFMGRVL